MFQKTLIIAVWLAATFAPTSTATAEKASVRNAADTLWITEAKFERMCKAEKGVYTKETETVRTCDLPDKHNADVLVDLTKGRVTTHGMIWQSKDAGVAALGNLLESLGDPDVKGQNDDGCADMLWLSVNFTEFRATFNLIICSEYSALMTQKN